MLRLAIFASFFLTLAGCASQSATTAAAPAASTAADWSVVQKQRLENLLQGTPYTLTEVEQGWLIRIAEQGTFHPQRPELLLPAALGSIGQITRHLAQDQDIAVMVVGVATGQYKLKSKEQVSHERASSVASIFRLNRVPGHRLKTLGVSHGEKIDKQLGVALLVVPEQELHARMANDSHGQMVAMLNSN